jgi:hypothetical protein
MITPLDTEATLLPAGALLIDEVMPVYEVRQVQHVVVEAPPSQTFAAIDRLDFGRDRLVQAISQMRLLPDRLGRRREQPADAAADYEQFTAMWTPLGEEPGVPKVLGLVGAFWRRDAGLIKVAAEDFTAFERPGFGKIALGYTVTPYGRRRSILTTETRVALTDEAARRRFRRYWLLIGPGARFIMGRALKLMRADAERQAATGEVRTPR